MTTTVTRALLQTITTNPQLLRFFEQLFATGQETAGAIEGQAGATRAIQDATVLTLSSNAAFNNERVVVFGAAFEVTDGGPGGTLQIDLIGAASVNGGYSVTFNASGDTSLDLPVSGIVLVNTITDADYADDAAAAAAGVAVGQAYRKTGGTVAWRVS